MAASHLVFLPGMMCDERLFAPQIEALATDCLVADLGKHDSIERMAEGVLDDAPPTFALAGLSMGGIVAFDILRRAPERVTHLALMDTNPHPDAPKRRSLRLQQIEDVLAGRLREVAVEGLKPLYLAARNRDDAELLELILDMALGLGPIVFERQSRALAARKDSVPSLAAIRCPTVVLCGEEDHLCPIAYHELMARDIPEATLTIVPESGHLPTLEKPRYVTRVLEQLLLH